MTCEIPLLRIFDERLAPKHDHYDDFLRLVVMDALEEMALRYQVPVDAAKPLTEDILEKVREELKKFNSARQYPGPLATTMEIHLTLPQVIPGQVGAVLYKDGVCV